MDNTPGDKLGVWRDMRLADALVYIYIRSFITFLSYYSKIAFLDCLHDSFVLTGLDRANQFLVFSHLNFMFDST